MGKIAPLWLLKRLPNMTSCHVAIQHNAQGPNNTITCRDSSALLALAESVRVIERGAADVVIVGATSSNIHPVDLTKYNLFENLTPQDDPDSACRPFDVTRNGTVIGEGAAAFVVERYDHAIRRGAEIYGEVIGVGAGCDGSGYTNGSGGRGIARAIQAALKRAGIAPRDIGHINADGKSTQREDLVEAKGYHWGLGESALKIPVTAMKSYFGHFDAGSGAVELAGTLLSLKHQLVPPTLNYKIPDPRCRLNVVPEPLELRSSTAMTVNRTSMGQSVAAIIRTL
jgi:3-oxoacyl-[acyl-carrier-protein] synthase II